MDEGSRNYPEKRASRGERQQKVLDFLLAERVGPELVITTEHVRRMVDFTGIAQKNYIGAVERLEKSGHLRIVGRKKGRLTVSFDNSDAGKGETNQALTLVSTKNEMTVSELCLRLRDEIGKLETEITEKKRLLAKLEEY